LRTAKIQIFFILQENNAKILHIFYFNAFSPLFSFHWQYLYNVCRFTFLRLVSILEMTIILKIYTIIKSSYISYAALILLAVAMPLSPFLISVAQIILIVHFFIGGNLAAKWEKIREHKAVCLFVGLFALHLLGLIYTHDFNYAFQDLKIKLPLLILPFIIASLDDLNDNKLRFILLSFAFATAISVAISLGAYLGLFGFHYKDIREISFFISHIRLSLMVVLAMAIIFYYSYINSTSTFKISWFSGFFFLLFLSFLVALQTLTGVIALYAILSFITFFFYKSVKPSWMVSVLFLVVGVLPVIGSVYLYRAYKDYKTVSPVDFSSLPQLTQSGNPYIHDTLCDAKENGNYINIYLCYSELEKEWNKRSPLSYFGNDNKDNHLPSTLIRYLTSRNYTKDSAGISKLTVKDILNIENGCANYILCGKNGLYPRFYVLIWELDNYFSGGSPSGHSVAQRFVYFRNAVNVIKTHFWLGTGTGDVQDEIKKMYVKNKEPLQERWMLRAHNQFATIWLAFGVFGFIYFIMFLFLPAFLEKNRHKFFFAVTLLLFILSMINEDTLETQAGVTFFVFFLSLALFFTPVKKN